MAAFAGRNVRLKRSSDGGTTFAVVAGGRTLSVDFEIENIDVTDKDDDGVRQLLAEIGTYGVSWSFEGVIKDDTFVAILADPARTALDVYQIDVGGLGTLEGQFAIAGGLSGEDGANAGMQTLSGTSSGEIVYTSA